MTVQGPHLGSSSLRLKDARLGLGLLGVELALHAPRRELGRRHLRALLLHSQPWAT